MRAGGYIVMAVGVFWVIAALLMDVSVGVGDGYRVNNIGLMASKQNYILIGGFVSIAGLLISIFGDKLKGGTIGRAQCPFCAEEINPEAIKCKHCGSDLTSTRLESKKSNTADIEEAPRLDGVDIKIPLIIVFIVFALIIISIVMYRM